MVTPSENSKVSIVIPIYNSEKYLKECIESVINQTYSDWELILIDDGSTDKSVEICENFFNEDHRIKILCQNHAGASAARKKGIENSVGSYITFVDSDDCIDKTMLEKMLMIMLSDKTIDVSVCSYSKFRGSTNNVLHQENVAHPVIQTRQRALENIFEEKKYTWSLWGKIYKKSLFYCDNFINTWWPPTYGDDTYVNWNIFNKINKVVFIPTSLYYYRVNSGSIMYQKVDKSKLIYFEVYDYVLREITDLRSTLAQRILRAMFEIGIDILLECIITGQRNDDWFKSYYLLKKYTPFYEMNLSKQQLSIYKLFSMSDSELDSIKCERLCELKSFCARHQYVFIYGAGKFAREVAETMKKYAIKFNGFVVTENKNGVQILMGQKVFSYEYMKNMYKDMDIGIITGLARKNLIQVLPLLKEMDNWEITDGTKINLRIM